MDPRTRTVLEFEFVRRRKGDAPEMIEVQARVEGEGVELVFDGKVNHMGAKEIAALYALWTLGGRR